MYKQKELFFVVSNIRCIEHGFILYKHLFVKTLTLIGLLLVTCT